MADIVVVGIGNPYRGDDGAGWAVIDRLKEVMGCSIEFVKQRGDIAELIDIFAHYHTVYLVDAYQSHALMEAWRRIDIYQESIPDEHPQTSTHGFSIAQAISLARNLDQLPNKLILYSIKGDNYAISDRLSPSVAESVGGVVTAILKEIQHA
jgi:hydrogenase maturation protease